MDETQSAPDKVLDKTLPYKDTDFDSDGFDITPMNKGRFTGLNERIFELMRPKRKKAITQQPIPLTPARVPDPSLPSAPVAIELPPARIPKGFEVQNGLLLKKKSLAERVRDQIRFPVINKVPAITNGVALLVFVVGAYILYSELPTHPELVVGIVLCIIAGNVIVSNRG